MTQRLALLGTVALAAFTIVLLGALAAYAVLNGPAATAAASTNNTAGVTAPAQIPAPPQDTGGQQALPQPPSSGDVNTSESYPLSADAAASIALGVAPGTSIVQQPRLVNLRGTVAYEVALDRGYVYVDASSGQVLFNGASPRSSRRGRR